MKIRSRLRLIVIPVILFVILACGIVPFTFAQRFIKDKTFATEQDNTFWIILLVSLVFIAIQFYFLYIIITKTLLITISQKLRSITFYYPLLFKKQIFSFEEIVGFRFSSVYSKTNKYKSIIFKTKSSKTFSITDFETSNFRQIEKFSIDNFILRKGKTFETLSTEERENELNRNSKFDIQQAKDYRFTCYLLIGLIISVYFIDKYLAIPSRRVGWLEFGLCIIILLFSIDKIRQANKTIKTYSQQGFGVMSAD